MNKHLILKEKIEKEMLISNFDFEELEKRYEMGGFGHVFATGC